MKEEIDGFDPTCTGLHFGPVSSIDLLGYLIVLIIKVIQFLSEHPSVSCTDYSC